MHFVGHAAGPISPDLQYRVENNRSLTWSLLLARWTDFARSAVALPDTGEPGRWKKAVPDVIALQAVYHALGEADALPEDERALGLDRSDVLIKKHAAALHDRWRAEPMPEALTELVEDARAALAAARDGGVEFIVTTDGFTMPEVSPPGGVEAFLAAPGSELARGEPAGFLRAESGGAVPLPAIQALAEAVPGAEPRRTAVMRQVYVQPDTSRVVAKLTDTLPAGMPLLRPVSARA